VNGADAIAFCGDGGPQTNVHVTIRYNDPGKGTQLLDDLQFDLILPCV
jgi:uncharacterized membrane protein